MIRRYINFLYYTKKLLSPELRPLPSFGGRFQRSYNLSAALIFIECISDYIIRSLSYSRYWFNGRSALAISRELVSISTHLARNAEYKSRTNTPSTSLNWAMNIASASLNRLHFRGSSRSFARWEDCFLSSAASTALRSAIKSISSTFCYITAA